jgi:hypothetical protein
MAGTEISSPCSGKDSSDEPKSIDITVSPSIGSNLRLGSVAGPVIQDTGRSEIEEGLGSGDFVSGYSYHMSRLSDHKKQTKFQSQRPNDVETPVPSISSTEVQQHRDSQYLDG